MAPRLAAPAAVAPAGFPITGIDLSSHQATVLNWAQIAQSTRFAYVKATEGGTFLSSAFATQYAGAKAAGLYTGGYHFGRPDSPTSAQAQADLFVNQLGQPNAKSLPPMLDIEDPYLSGGVPVAPPCWGKTPAQLVTWIRTFVNEVKLRTGSPTLIYTGSFWNTCTGSSTAFSDQLLFFAKWQSTPPTTLPASWTKWTFWQYSATGTLPNGQAVDQDVFNGSPTALAALAAQTMCRPLPAGISSPTMSCMPPTAPKPPTRPTIRPTIRVPQP